MSDQITIFIPHDPRFVPTKEAQHAAVTMLGQLAPRPDDIASDVDDEVTFRDCGENFESVACPNCRRKIDLGRWQGWMSEDYSEGSGFCLRSFATSCCATTVTLNDLVYKWPQGFSRYYLSARNVGSRLSAASMGRLEKALGCKLRTIRQRI